MRVTRHLFIITAWAIALANVLPVVSLPAAAVNSDVFHDVGGARREINLTSHSSSWQASPALPGIWSNLGARPDEAIKGANVMSVAVDANGRVYVGGRFNDVAGISAADHIAMWDPVTNQWSALGDSAALNDAVTSIAIAPDGLVYVGGDFTDAAGIPAADYVAVWDPVARTWGSLGSNSSGDGVIASWLVQINALAIDSSGKVYVGGFFFDVAGIAAADSVAVWDPSTQTWAALGSNSSGNGAITATVNALAVDSNGKVYAGGNFTNVAGIAAADFVAMWDPATQLWSALGSNGSGNGAIGADSNVYALTIDGNGNLYVGGIFNDVAGLPAADTVAMWNPAAQTWSALGSNGSGNGAISGFVGSFAVDSNGRIYVGGSFSNAADLPAADFIAVWNPNTQAWSALGSNGDGDGAIPAGFLTVVKAIAVDGSNQVYAGGIFFDVAGLTAADYIAKWDGTTWTNLSLPTLNALDNQVNAMAVDANGRWYVGGYFLNAGGIDAADYIALWDPATEQWSSLGRSAALNGIVTSIAIAPNGLVYVGGDFTDAAGIPAADYVAVWNPATQTWGALGSNGSGDGAIAGMGVYVSALAVDSSGKVYVGGWFNNVAGIAAADSVAMWNPATGQWSALGNNGFGNGVIVGFVNALAVDGSGRVYVGGVFGDVAGIAAADSVAMWNPATGQWSALGSNGNGDGALTAIAGTISVNVLTFDSNGKLYVGGIFAMAGSPEAGGVAMWDPVASQWHALGNVNVSEVYGLTVAGNYLYVGGIFNDAAGIPAADYLAVWNLSTQTWMAPSATSDLNDVVLALQAVAPYANDIMVGGNFTDVAGNSQADFIVRYGIPPRATIARAGATPTNVATVAFTVTFDEPVTNVDPSDFTLTANGMTGASIASVTGSGMSYTVIVNTGSGDGTLGLNLAGGTNIADAAGNAPAAVTGPVYTIDKTAPTATIALAAPSPTNAASVAFTVTFSEPVSGVDTGDFGLNISGGITGASITSVSSIGSATYAVTVNTGSGNGTLGLNLLAGATIADAAGNAPAAVTGPVYTINKTVLAALIGLAGSNPTKATSVAFTVLFGEPVNGVDPSDFALISSGLTGASIVNVTGSGSLYTVTVNTGSGSGTLGLQIPASATITTLSGTGLSAAVVGPAYTIDRIKPAATIALAGSSPTNAATVAFTVAFSEPVSNVSADDFAVNPGAGITGASVASVAGSGTIYTVTVNTGSGDGLLGLNLKPGTDIADTAGNASPVAVSGPSYTIDKTAPTAAIALAGAATTNTATVAFTVTFNELATNVTPDDFALNASGLSGANIAGVSPANGFSRTYTVTVNTGSGINGTLALNLKPATDIADAAGNMPPAPVSGPSYVIDRAPLTVTIQRATPAALTCAANVAFIVTFNKAVTGVDSNDFAVTGGASIASVTGSGNSYTITVNLNASSGVIRLDIPSGATISDVAGNPLSGLPYTSGQTYQRAMCVYVPAINR